MPTLTSPLDEILGSTSKVRILRALVPRSDPVSARELARLTGMSLPPVLRALDDLAALGVVERQVIGNQFLCRVHRQHFLVREALTPLFSAETRWTEALFAALRSAIASLQRPSASTVLAAGVIGSVARGEDRPDSDLDLLAITRDARAVDPVFSHLADATPALGTTFGVRLSPVVLDLARARKQWRARDPFLVNAVREARRVYGDRDLDEVLHG